MSRLFRNHPEAVAHTVAIAERCDVDLDFSDYRFPDFPLPEDETPATYLAKLCKHKARERYEPVDHEVETRIAQELRLIGKLGLSGYFLIVWDIMDYARRNGIPAQGRGSAANSIVAYILGITKVDPIKNKLFLGRFLNEEMSSLPDIDIDVSTKHREQLIQYVYGKYGQHHTAMVCTYVTFRARNAIREVGKVLGLPHRILDRMAKSVSVYSARHVKEDLAHVEEFERYVDSGPWKEFLALCREVADFPRHVSIHNGGIVISSCPLTSIVPLERATMPGRVVCQWDKDGVADAGLIKLDLLGLRMLSAIHESGELVEREHHVSLDLEGIPLDDEAVYDMICRGDTIGVFQVESRAQLQTLPQTRPRSIEDLTVEVAIVRPGPIQGNMVHPYIRRRKGLETVQYLHPALKPILEDTLGVILFQEQVIQVATAVARFSPGEADLLRRAMSRKKSREAMEEMKQRFVDGAEGNGVEARRAVRIFESLAGFAEYGFCKSHAAGFALLCYQSAWLKNYYAAEFYCALLNNQPMGFYSPEVIVRDAGRHGVEILPVDIRHSDESCTVSRGRIRLGFMYVKGMGSKAIRRIVEERRRAPYRSLDDFHSRTGLERKLIENLILSGAFDFSKLPRRQLLWQLGVLDKRSPEGLSLEFPHPEVVLPQFSELEQLRLDYEVQGFPVTYHPMQVVNRRVPGQGLLKSCEVNRLPANGRARMAGYVITRQRPATAKGFAFITLEDEEGVVNVVVKPNIYEEYRQVLKLECFVIVEGVVQRRDGNVNIIASAFAPILTQPPTAEVLHAIPSRT